MPPLTALGLGTVGGVSNVAQYGLTQLSHLEGVGFGETLANFATGFVGNLVAGSGTIPQATRPGFFGPVAFRGSGAQMAQIRNNLLFGAVNFARGFTGGYLGNSPQATEFLQAPVASVKKWSQPSQKRSPRFTE
jgi:hypothetical protein